MAKIKFTLDKAGVAELLKSDDFQAAVHEKAVAISAAAEGALTSPAEHGVVVDDYETDRAASSVTIRDVRAKAWEARDGILTRAAGKAGLEVRSRAD